MIVMSDLRRSRRPEDSPEADVPSFGAIRGTRTHDHVRSRSGTNFYIISLTGLRIIDSKITCAVDNPIIWTNEVPRKVTGFAWRACMDRIFSAVALSLRGVSIPTSCNFCSNGLDSTDHILIGCSFATEVLQWTLKWCNIPWQTFDSVKDLVGFAANWGRCPKKRRILIAIVYDYLWFVWKARSDMVFNKRHTTPTNTADHIIIEVYNWVNFRGNFGRFIWSDSLCCPFKTM
uniref:Reverse transcriptase zinc-binding domain-containing protein n=1 Tax=Lactuca sativa TaxID=4236 RepID=A0A9R1WTH3_LACSA|nr:hypothetical protein LSAT_V11C100042030 [Lactuca sativa]